MAIDPIDLPTYISDLEAGSVWGSSNINFMFWTSTPSYYLPEDFESHGFKPFTAADKAVAYEALNMLSSFANITFTEVTDQANHEGDAQIGFGKAVLDPSAEAWAYYPDDVDPRGGDVWANTTYFSEKRLGHGQYDFLTIVHELGHAVGLKHSFETPELPPEFENRQYTVMSYTNGPTYGNIQPETYMVLDIATIQALYGANMTYHTGDDNYALMSRHVYTIWDAGGADTFDASLQTQGVTLDLQEGHYSSVGMVDNIGIAFGVTIENAFGTNAGDIIYDNAVDNYIHANGGNDTVYDTGGNDTIDCGTGTDTVIFDTDSASASFHFLDSTTVIVTSAADGVDTIQGVEKFQFTDGTFTYAQLETGAGGVGAPVDLSLVGGVNSDTLYGSTGNDTLFGGDGRDTLLASSGNDTLDGGLGTDQMRGGDGDDLYYVDNSGDRVIELSNVGSGTDTVHSSISSYTLPSNVENLILDGTAKIGTGNTLNNIITGNAFDNKLSGGSGNDTLDGGGGHDTLIGGTGADTFVFHSATAYDGVAAITDFTVAQGDVLDISDVLTGYGGGAADGFVEITNGPKGTSILSVDANGTSNFTPIATLNGVTNLDADTLFFGGHLIL